ncbi:purine-cytosine permease family protein [Pseudomonas putida]|uniref:purine-cytosine permease family protein n=1 Tax=Pseudomonas putida TaxID=303 RepID=UPI003839EA3D
MARDLSSKLGLNVEVRSIEHIPSSERRGKAWHLAPFWFTGNFVLTTMATGFLGPATGLQAWQAILSIVLGVMVGTLCMALHANQGPRLGLAQMIQSRAQFGLYGAVLPLMAVIGIYIGFNVFNLTLASEILSPLLPGPASFWQGGLLAVALLIAMVGHDLLHTVQRWLTYVLIAVFGWLTVTALGHLEFDTAQPSLSFSWAAFFGQFSVAAAYQFSYAVYVSDYSRYLPEDTPARRVIGWTYLGAAASAIWLMSLGALLSSALPADGPTGYVKHLGDLALPGFGTFATLVAVPALVGIMAINCYGAMLSGASALSAIGDVKLGARSRVLGIAVTGVIIYLVTLSLPDNYLESFSLFLQLLLYFLLPWSAINLTDFYVLRKGRYVTSELFNKDGIYGRWALPGIFSYTGALLAMLPFTSLGSYQGWMVAGFGGIDLAAPIGFFVAVALYASLTYQRKATYSVQESRP